MFINYKRAYAKIMVETGRLARKNERKRCFMKTKPRLYTNALFLLLLANVLAYTTVHLCYLFMMESFGIYLELART